MGSILSPAIPSYYTFVGLICLTFIRVYSAIKTQNLLATGSLPQTPYGKPKALPTPIAGGRVSLPLPRNPTPVLGPAGLGIPALWTETTPHCIFANRTLWVLRIDVIVVLLKNYNFILIFATLMFQFFQPDVKSAPLIIEFPRSAEVVEKVVKTKWSKPSVGFVARFQPQRNYRLLRSECILRLCTYHISYIKFALVRTFVDYKHVKFCHITCWVCKIKKTRFTAIIIGDTIFLFKFTEGIEILGNQTRSGALWNCIFLWECNIGVTLYIAHSGRRICSV